MAKYVALLRGINLGKRSIKMADLKSAFEKMGFDEVKTLLASGNVIFSSSGKPDVGKMEQKLKEKFGFDIFVILRSQGDIKKLIAKDPFKNSIPGDKLFVTFLYDKKEELFSALAAEDKTTDFMTAFDKKYGKKITTRNWNTVKKLQG